MVKKSLLIGVVSMSALALLTTISAYSPSPVIACHQGTPHGQETVCPPPTPSTVKSITNTQDTSNKAPTTGGSGGSATQGDCKNRCSATGGSGGGASVTTGDINASPTIN